MELATVLGLLSRYGVLILLVITLLEALNCPFMPAGIILPAAGVFAAHGDISVWQAIVMTIVGSMLGSLVLYFIGIVGGAPMIEWMKKRSPRAKKTAEKCERFLEKGGFVTVFIGRILPVVRTILPLPAGAFRVRLSSFMLASLAGISCYNIACVCAGYFFGNAFL